MHAATRARQLELAVAHRSECLRRGMPRVLTASAIAKGAPERLALHQPEHRKTPHSGRRAKTGRSADAKNDRAPRAADCLRREHRPCEPTAVRTRRAVQVAPLAEQTLRLYRRGAGKSAGPAPSGPGRGKRRIARGLRSHPAPDSTGDRRATRNRESADCARWASPFRRGRPAPPPSTDRNPNRQDL